MTLKQLQRYLETEKWRETAKRGYDLCGAYARCAHCNRYDEYPCAEAHNRYIASQDFSAEEEGLLPEPPIKRIFGADVAEEKEAAPVKEQPVRREPSVTAKPEPAKIPIQRLVREKPQVQAAPVVSAPAVSAEPAPEKKSVQPHLVLTRGRRKPYATRLLVLRRK